MENNKSASSLPPVAPKHLLPAVHYYSVEYPGYVKNESVNTAIHNLGDQRQLDYAFRRATKKQDCGVEVKLRPDDPFSHPVAGDMVATNNVLLKVVRRRRKPMHGLDSSSVSLGEYKVEAVGTVHKTARFRSMADFQYHVPKNEPMLQLRTAMAKMDVDTIKSFRIQPMSQEGSMTRYDARQPIVIDPRLINGNQESPSTGPAPANSSLRLLPPPLFSRQNLPLNYQYKANPASLPTTVTDEVTGEERARLINRMRWKGLSSASIAYDNVDVPLKPPKNVEETRERVNKTLLASIHQRFEERPIWSKAAILNQFTVNEAREIHKLGRPSSYSKNILPLVAYVFTDGPWRDTHVRFGYDPRKDIEARFYQRIYFRNIGHQITRMSVAETRADRLQERAAQALKQTDKSQSHVFDGRSLNSETAAFQLCDIVDPMLKDMVDDDDDLREVCHDKDGWYKTEPFEQIKIVLRHKFYSLLDGYVATDEECNALLVPSVATGKVPVAPHSRKARHHKHNMAKGALPMEDAAAQRLRSQIEKNASIARIIQDDVQY